ncbi:MAG TPA: outer membrane beta-barrel protein [Dongiaceae bacterium]|nr:outer membrane beta-barrel protein [Dongiaceae bacterium]
MKKSLAVIAALTVLAIPVVCTAATVRPGGYMSGFVGINVNQDASVASTDFVTNRDFNDQVEFDPNINIGGTAGYNFGIVRLEGELSYKHAEIGSVTSQSNGFRFRNVNGGIGALAMMFNGFLDLHNDSRLTPYLGGGIGFASLHLSDTTGFNSNGERIVLYGAADDTVFAYQAGTGVEIALDRRYSLDIGYRYFATGRGNFDSDLPITTSLKFRSHNAALGFRYRF